MVLLPSSVSHAIIQEPAANGGSSRAVLLSLPTCLPTSFFLILVYIIQPVTILFGKRPYIVSLKGEDIMCKMFI